MLNISALSFSYNPKTPVLTNLNLELKTPSLIGFLGPDGAGKSTLFKMLATLLRPKSGSIIFNDSDINVSRSDTRKRIGYMPEKFSLYEDLTVAENLEFFGRLFGYNPDEIMEKMNQLFVFSRLEKFKNWAAGHLSGGMKQKLALSCMLMHDPELLILDEPTTGVDPASRDEFWSLLQELREQGHTILVSSPYIDEVASCDTIAILDRGNLLGMGSPDRWIDQVPCKVWVIRTPDIMNAFQELTVKFHVPLFLFGQSIHWFDQENLGKQGIEKRLGKAFQVESAPITLEDAVLWTLQKNK